MIILIVLASFIPALILYLYLSKRKDDPQYKKYCGTMFLAGVLSSFGVIGLDLLLTIALKLLKLNEIHPLLSAALKCFLVNAFAEEYMKYHFTRKRIRKHQIRYSFLDLMTYFCITALGFEILESIVYAFMTNPMQIIVRGLTCLHGCYGLTMGYFMAKKELTGEKKYGLYGLLIPMLLHGFYNFFLSEAIPEPYDMLVLVFLFAAIIIGVRLLIRMRKNKDKEEYNRILNPLAVPANTDIRTEEVQS